MLGMFRQSIQAACAKVFLIDSVLGWRYGISFGKWPRFQKLPEIWMFAFVIYTMSAEHGAQPAL